MTPLRSTENFFSPWFREFPMLFANPFQMAMMRDPIRVDVREHEDSYIIEAEVGQVLNNAPKNSPNSILQRAIRWSYCHPLRLDTGISIYVDRRSNPQRDLHRQQKTFPRSK